MLVWSTGRATLTIGVVELTSSTGEPPCTGPPTEGGTAVNRPGPSSATAGPGAMPSSKPRHAVVAPSSNAIACPSTDHSDAPVETTTPTAGSAVYFDVWPYVVAAAWAAVSAACALARL